MLSTCHACLYLPNSVTRWKLPNVYKNCPKMISLEKWYILTPLQKMPKNVGDLGKLIVAEALKSCPKSKNRPIWSHCYLINHKWMYIPHWLLKLEKATASKNFKLLETLTVEDLGPVPSLFVKYPKWLWCNWQSGRLQYQKTRVRIQSSATLIEHLFTVNCL